MSEDCFVDFVRTRHPDYRIAPEGWFSDEETFEVKPCKTEVTEADRKRWLIEVPSIPKLKPKAKRELEKLEEQKPTVKREKLEKQNATDSKPIVIQEKQRFSYVTEEKRSDYTERKPPKTTTYSTSWALRNFNSWAEHRNSHFPDSPVPTTLLTTGTKKELTTTG